MRLHQVVRTCLLVVPAVVVAVTVHAQSAAPLRLKRLGLVAGANSSTFGGKDAVDPTPSRRSGGTWGAFLVIPIRSRFGFQPEFVYSMKGAAQRDPSGSAVLTMNYIEVPLLARFDFPTSGGVKPFFYGGPAISFQRSCDIEVTAAFIGTIRSTCDDFAAQFGGTADFKSTDFGAIIGGGLAFDVSGKTLSIGARYAHGFSKIEKDSDIKHRVISVLATFEFPFR